MTQLKYPIGIETFSEIIEGGYQYVDKTEVIYKLTTAGKYFFLSRPRRFGKSLMLSTMEAYFEGRKELFEGLWLGQAEGVDWTPRPVLRLNFISAKSESADLKLVLSNYFCEWEQKYGIDEITESLAQRFRNIIAKAHEVTGQRVVVLIDEYDKVLVNTMHNEELHTEMKTILRPVFSILKESDRHIHFAMLTGVSRFSKLSIFSDLNNLNDISLDDRFCTICGITEAELRRDLSAGVEAFAAQQGTDFEGMMQILKENYDGYHFSENCPDIYNPFSLINSLASLKIIHRWFESGTPTFLVERIKHTDEDITEVLNPVTSGYSLSTLSITDTDLANLLYQTGYLTIKSYDAEEDMYQLGVPNKEVEIGLYRCLLPLYNGREMTSNDTELYKLRKAIRAGEAERFVALLRSFLAGVPQHLSQGQHEIYYENNIYIILRLLGFSVETEYKTSDGRIDALLKTANYIYILELKLNGTAEEAMAQIERKNYALPFEIDGRQIIRIGLSFSKETRTIDGWVIA